MNTPRNLKTIAGCPTRILVSITAPEDTDTELTGYVNSAGTPLAAAVQGSAQEGEVLFPPLPAGEHLYEIRLAGKPIAWGHLLARQTAYPPNPTDIVDWELTADLTATDAAQISLQLLPGARGLTGESAYDAAVEGGYQGTEEEFAAMLAALPQDAANAAESAADAAASQAAAAASETAAAASATAAGNSATAAANSATTASTQATEAANSATTAATKATDAATSATAAAASATEAGISVASAGASAQDAADDAADASTAAATATAQAALATTQAGNAAASATTASQQATAAGNSASAAADSATTAGTKASEAAGSASTAATKATEAANSANAAALSAEDAQEAAELLGDAALQGRNNTFTQTNTFNGTVALNGPIQGSGTVGGSVLAADEAVAFGIGKGLFERDSRVAPAAAYVIYGPTSGSQPALLSIPADQGSAAARTAVYNGPLAPRYIILRGKWQMSSHAAYRGELINGKWSWQKAENVTATWVGSARLTDFFSTLPAKHLEINMPDMTEDVSLREKLSDEVEELVFRAPLATRLENSWVYWHTGNGTSIRSLEVYMDRLETLGNNQDIHVYPAGYGNHENIGHLKLYMPALKAAPYLFRFGGKFKNVPVEEWLYFLQNIPDWTEDTAVAYRSAISAYNTAHPDTPVDAPEGATLAELAAAVEEHNTQYSDSKCTVTQPHPIGLAAVENCYAAVAQWLDDGGIPYTREPGHAPVAVLPYGWSISYLS